MKSRIAQSFWLMLLVAALSTSTFVQCTSVPSSGEVRGVSYTEFAQLTDAIKDQKELKKSWNLWKAESWPKLQNYVWSNNLNDSFPPADGFVGIEDVTLTKGTMIDRYGGLTGTFVAPAGTPMGQRALPPWDRTATYRKFEVLGDISNVQKGKAIPWYGQPGMGIQFNLPGAIDSLIKVNLLKIVETKPN